ncbi:hypothetical protein P261_01802 [Lachnospiraceae bacterium TWA4]|nr:hypothetical protein P261_01802 [Lachnospiraceae bacterium TWA4]
MQFHQTVDGKKNFISIDTRNLHHNPLYRAWKTKSFTDGDITLHFILMDVLDSWKNLNTIMNEIDEYITKTFDESTIRKKLKEYIVEGIIESKKQGKNVYYRRAKLLSPIDPKIIHFFSEVAPCGVIGSFLLDDSIELEKDYLEKDYFTFKHHYITSSIDSEILYTIFLAMHDKRKVLVEISNHRKNEVVPLRVMISVQSGRQYLMAYVPYSKRIRAFRIDFIHSIKITKVSEEFDQLREKLRGMLPHIWGVSTQSSQNNRMEHIEFTLRYADSEKYILKRLEREKRCGRVEQLDENSCKFSADVFDATEMIPWIRTFICRITSLESSNKEIEKLFKSDLYDMYTLYDLDN